MRISFFTCSAGLLFAAVLFAADSPVPPLYLDPSLPIERRVDDLVGRMTLEEKASQLVNQSRPIPRLQVPAYDWWSEALHGVAGLGTGIGFATVFPQPTGLAASFNAPLIHEMAVAISIEGRAKHHAAVRAGRRTIMEGLTFWSPNINLFRDPRWGRGQETYGEDPHLIGRMGVAFVTGMQGDDPKYYRTIATPKHYAVHSGPEPLRHGFDAKVSKHDIEDTYLPGFRDAIVEGKAASTMCVYNAINGIPGCADPFLMKDQLRDKWGFTGVVVSDCGAVLDIMTGHHYVKTPAEAAAVSIKAGMDNECADFFVPMGSDNSDYVRYIDAVKQGLIAEKDVDAALRRLFYARFKLGMFDPPAMVKYAQIPESANDTAAHRRLALKIARQTMTLLKNDGTLPLKPTVKRIAVVGPLADQIRVLEGNYHGTPSRATTALDGIRRQFAKAQVSFDSGTSFLREFEVVPDAVLTAPDGARGLKAEFFPGAEYKGAPALTRVDPQIDYGLGSSAPVPSGPISARWTGFLTPAESGTWKLGVGGIFNRLYLDGKLLVEDMVPHAPGAAKAADVTLEKGRRYEIRMEASGRMGRVVARLMWSRVYPDAIDRAVASARQADIVVAVVGINSDLEGEEMSVDIPGFKGGDRTSLDLPKEEEDLLKAVKATGKPLVVVLMNGSALSVNWADRNANAILEAWYSGEEGGAAIAETLAGANNPAGRLPVTFYKGVEQLPDFADYSMRNRTYRYFRGEPLYPFGYGLSYSKFEYAAPKLSAAALKAGQPLTVEADVKNASGPAGDEVVQVYLNFPQIPGAPIRALRGFARVPLQPGETRRVSFTLQPRDLSMVNEAGDRLVAPGAYTISVGGGQPGTKAAAVSVPLTIEGEQRLPE